MNIITLDFETYFDQNYTLKKMTTEAYVRDPRFQAIGLGIRYSNGASAYEHTPDEIRNTLADIDWSTTGVVCHHAHFDGLILAHHYGHRPAFWFDTLCLGRHVLGPGFGVALGALAHHFKLGEKSMDYVAAKGSRSGLGMKEGCLRDVELTWTLFKIMQIGFPQEEFRLIDMTIRMFTEPQLLLDGPHYEWLREKEWVTKNEMLMELGTTEAELGSPERFAAMLRTEGIEPEEKNGKNGPIFAFAKTDDFMRELADHDSERVRKLVEARLAIKSTIDETRAGRLAAMAGRGRAPIYLQYYGAANTGRWSGGDAVNWQNFRRDGELRKGVCAPQGYKLGVVDLSQIECRMLNYVAGEEEVLKRFRNGEDPYLPLASEFYGREITADDKKERGLGKLLELSCGYGAGGSSIVRTAARGTYGPPITLSPADGHAASNVYRLAHPRVTMLWREGDKKLGQLKSREESSWCRDLLRIRDGKIIMPNGSYLNYWLQLNTETRMWERKTRHGWKKIWGGVVCQNICEALSRLALGQALLRLQVQGIRALCTVHDEAWFLYPERDAEALHALVLAEMSKSPSWAPDLPLACEGSIGDRYEKK